LHLMLKRRRERIVRGFENFFSSFIGFTASIVVRGVDVIAGESITLFDIDTFFVCHINLCDSLNA